MEIKVQATQPGKKNSSHSGAVIRYSTPATSTLLRRQEKCVACQVPDGESTPEALLAQADAHLYRAKQAGRNRADDGTDVLS